jgi:hypothetical protein
MYIYIYKLQFYNCKLQIEFTIQREKLIKFLSIKQGCMVYLALVTPMTVVTQRAVTCKNCFSCKVKASSEQRFLH